MSSQKNNLNLINRSRIFKNFTGWPRRTIRFSTLRVKIRILAYSLKPTLYSIGGISFKAQKNLNWILWIYLNFRFMHIIAHFQLFVCQLISKLNISICEHHINTSSLIFLKDLYLRPQRSRIQSTLNQSLHSRIQPYRPNRNLGRPTTCNITADNLGLDIEAQIRRLTTICIPRNER